MAELLFDNIMDGESLVKDILRTDGVSSITDNNGKSYWWNTIDKAKKYRVKKYEYDKKKMEQHKIIHDEINRVAMTDIL